MGELYLDGYAAGGEGPLDLLKGSRARDIAEAELRDLVERRALLGEARQAAGNRHHERRRVRPPTGSSLAGPGDELGLEPLWLRAVVGALLFRQTGRAPLLAHRRIL